MMQEDQEYDIGTEVFRIAEVVMKSTCEIRLGEKAGKELSIVNQCQISSITFTIQ